MLYAAVWQNFFAVLLDFFQHVLDVLYLIKYGQGSQNPGFHDTFSSAKMSVPWPSPMNALIFTVFGPIPGMAWMRGGSLPSS